MWLHWPGCKQIGRAIPFIIILKQNYSNDVSAYALHGLPVNYTIEEEIIR